MIYTYRISGNDGDDQDQVVTVDTESAAFQRRVAWISDMAGLPLPAVRSYLNRAPLTAGGNVAAGESLTYYGQAEWAKDGKTAAVDVQLIAGNPTTDLRGAIAWLNFELGLGMSAASIEGMIYQDPTPEEEQKDWEAPGAIIGEPMPGYPGWFQSRKMGHKEGYIWQGASGAQYRLEYMPGFAFFRVMAWRKL